MGEKRCVTTLITAAKETIRVLVSLESPGILLWHFPGLESLGKKGHWSWKVLEICQIQLNNMKCMEGSKENLH